MTQRRLTISVIGVSGKESVKGSQGVGKSVLCNRFLRSSYDDFIPEHSSVLSQADFGGSSVINNDHWLFWGEKTLEFDDTGSKVCVQVIEQTEFLDDETYDTLAGPSTSEGYSKRATRVKLESRDKLMYIRKEQLGLEAEYEQLVLPDGKCSVDCFIFVFDPSRSDRSFESQVSHATHILTNAVKTKKPVVIALSKCDILDEESRKHVQTLFSKKELKGQHFLVIEVSSFLHVNVDELFISAVNLSLKSKVKLKVLSFSESSKLVAERKAEIRNAYHTLLRELLPVKHWPVQRLSWSSLLKKLHVDRHADYCNYVYYFGTRAALRMYETHVNEAREYWMASRLKALLPSLPKVFETLLDRDLVSEITWSQANKIIHEHALFDEFFQPLGSLGKQLDPLSPNAVYDEKPGDCRMPAEILLCNEAQIEYDMFQQSVLTDNRKERLDDDFENLLSRCPQVTPGKPLAEVCIFLQDHEAFKLMPPARAGQIYDHYQNELIQRAKIDFNECLLENVDFFIESIENKKCFHNDSTISRTHLSKVKEHLQEDHRFRMLSRLFELRDNMIQQYISFLISPSISMCPAKGRCSDVSVHDAIEVFFQKRKSNQHQDTHLVDINVHGDMSVVVQFITEMNGLLGNESFLCSCGYATIRCFGADESDVEVDRPRTQMFLLDSIQSIEQTRELFSSNSSIDSGSLPPVFVLVCDPGQYDLLPTMHKQGSMLADANGGIFIGAGSADSESSCSRGSDCSSIFGRDQLLRVCDTVCSSQLDRRRCDMRVQTSIFCGDHFSVDVLLAALFPLLSDDIRAVVNPSLLSAGIVPVDVTYAPNDSSRLDITFGSYHNWLTTRSCSTIHGHILVFSARRSASFAYCRSAIVRILENGSHYVSGKSVLMVGMADVQETSGDDEQSNLLLTEASELATSIGATFVIVPPVTSHESSVTHKFISFFSKLKVMMPTHIYQSLDRKKRESDGYATLSQFHELALNSTSRPHQLQEAARTYGEYKASDMEVLSSSSRETPNSSIRSPQMTNTSTNSKPKRRLTPLTFSQRLPILRPDTAPLATPEHIEIAPDYSRVQDALTDDDNIYATLDLSPVEEAKKEQKPPKEKKVPLRSRMFGSQPSTSSMANMSNSSGAPLLLSSDRCVSRTSPIIQFTASSPDNKYLQSNQTLVRSSFTQPLSILRRTHNVKPSSSTFVSSPMPRSVTMNIIDRDTVIKARNSPAAAGVRTSLRQSLSAESLVDLMNGKKKKVFKEFGRSSFVRKVATSFRFKKAEKGEKEVDKEEEFRTLTISPPQASRSLPQSPRTDRRAGKKYGTLASSEKVSSGFSWLPSRSPKRANKTSPENTSSCVSTSTLVDSIYSLSDDDHLPLFLQRCVDFIENEGGFDLEGLYRVPGNQAQLLELEKYYKDKGDLDLHKLNMPVHVVATAVKNFFCQLPEPLIPYDMQERFLIASKGENIPHQLQEVCDALPKPNHTVLRFFLCHLHKVASSPATAMDTSNLSKVWFPTFFRPKFENFEEMSSGMAQFQLAMEALLVHSSHIF